MLDVLEGIARALKVNRADLTLESEGKLSNLSATAVGAANSHKEL